MQYSIFLVLKTGFGILSVQIITKVKGTQNKEPPEKFVKIQQLHMLLLGHFPLQFHEQCFTKCFSRKIVKIKRFCNVRLLPFSF